MSKIIFKEIQIKQLEKNKNVLKASERSISYCPDFKIRAVKENQQGKGPSQIFLENEFDLAVIGEKKPKQCLKRWRWIRLQRLLNLWIPWAQHKRLHGGV